MRQGKKESTLETEFQQLFTRRQAGKIALLLAANSEMVIDDIIKHVCPLKNKQALERFRMNNFDFSEQRIRGHEYSSDNPALEEKIKFRIKEEIGNIDRFVDNLGKPMKSLLDIGLQKKVDNVLFIIKSQFIDQDQMRGVLTIKEYLKEFIQRLANCFSKNIDEATIGNILEFGGIQPVIISNQFASDSQFRTKFTNILNNCKTFKSYQQYGGEDYQQQRAIFLEAVSKYLVGQQINQNTAHEICQELLNDPLSNMVALSEDLTNKQKDHLYRSKFYVQDGPLKAYAKVKHYERSLESRARKDISKILARIDVIAQNSKQTVACVISYNLFDLLMATSISNVKQSLFKMIVEQCPDYVKAFKLTKYQQNPKTYLKQIEQIDKKWSLIDIFFKIRLPYSQWDLAQEGISCRKYKVIDQLTLKFEAKHQLANYIFQVVEPSHHKSQRMSNYRSEVEFALLKKFMNTDLGNVWKIEKILQVIKENLDNDNFISQNFKQFSKGQQKNYNQCLKKCVEYQTYKKQNKKDIAEQLYVKRWDLMRTIYSNNLKDRIDPTFESVSRFIDKVFEENGRIPKNYPHLVTDTPKLNDIQIDTFTKVEEKIEPIVAQKIEDQQQLRRKFAQKSEQLVKRIIFQTNDGQFQRRFIQDYKKNAPNYIRRLIQTNAFSDPNSQYFTELKVNSLLLRKIKEQFKQNYSLFSSNLAECTQILKKISPDLKANAVKFIDWYIQTSSPESLMRKILSQKYNNDKENLVKDIINKAAFNDQNSSFYTQLKYNNFLTNNVKKQFLEKKDRAMEELSKCKLS